jgi:hypothetical protein
MGGKEPQKPVILMFLLNGGPIGILLAASPNQR